MPEKLANLKWQVQMGVDETISDTPNNRFEQKPINKINPKIMPVVNKSLPENSVAKALDMSIIQPNLSNPSAVVQHTRKIAQACGNLDELKSAILSFKDLSITKTATNTVFADGNPKSEVMLIGEAPGAEEDAVGIPFCGASGKLLDQMLSCIDLNRERNFYITNTIFWRPPGNRRPTPEELAICLPFVEKHIALIQPKLIILVGGTAIASLLNSKQGITSMRGNFYDYGNGYLDGTIKTTAIFHPSYLLRSPGQKRIAWKDLLMLKEYINKNAIKI